MRSPQALVLELQGLDALLLLLLLRLHLRHEARVDDEACIGRGTPWRQPARQQGADMAAAQQETPRCTGAGRAPAGWPLEVTAMTLRRGGRYSAAAIKCVEEVAPPASKAGFAARASAHTCLPGAETPSAARRRTCLRRACRRKARSVAEPRNVR